ncbi:hypothetical protein JTE90_003040 [Oedothorax gibbosus]|uniref:Sulfotransferase domain-containing protein n=1 Tax=Oedothorax gibbosus TaxID=931172 RepID=A0AAV6VBQ8_9ARAC|nr:hypothetical protein JTE90_003040 [Oedothorax gibbosus]
MSPKDHRMTSEKRVSPAARCFRRVLYGLVGIVLSSYVILFILVVTRHIDGRAQNDLKRSVLQDSASGRSVAMVGGIGPSLLKMERYQERWAAMARLEAGRPQQILRGRRRINVCVVPKLKRTPGPLVALASFPGSGNTWIRFLVQQATGILTGSVYRDYSLKRNGFPAEHVANGSVLLVKTHEWGDATRQKFDRAVLLVREPVGALVAEFNRRAGGHVGHAAPEKFTRGNAWPNFVQTHSKLWMESILDWLQFEGPLLVIRYEQMKEDLPYQLVRLLKFLEANVSWNSFQCIIRNRDGIFRRSKKNLSFDPFDDSMRRTVEGFKAVVETALRYHEQGIKFDISNMTLLQSSSNNVSFAMNAPMTYVEKIQNDNGS